MIGSHPWNGGRSFDSGRHHARLLRRSHELSMGGTTDAKKPNPGHRGRFCGT